MLKSLWISRIVSANTCFGTSTQVLALGLASMGIRVDGPFERLIRYSPEDSLDYPITNPFLPSGIHLQTLQTIDPSPSQIPKSKTPPKSPSFLQTSSPAHPPITDISIFQNPRPTLPSHKPRVAMLIP